MKWFARSLPVLALAMGAVHAADGWAEPVRIDGVWTGAYQCGGVSTTARLTLRTDGKGGVTGVFQFTPQIAGSPPPMGEFEMTGRVQADEGSIELVPGRWIRQPPRYRAAGMRVSTQDGQRMQGTIAMRNCTQITLTRTGEAPTIARNDPGPARDRPPAEARREEAPVRTSANPAPVPAEPPRRASAAAPAPAPQPAPAPAQPPAASSPAVDAQAPADPACPPKSALSRSEAFWRANFESYGTDKSGIKVEPFDIEATMKGMVLHPLFYWAFDRNSAEVCTSATRLTEDITRFREQASAFLKTSDLIGGTWEDAVKRLRGLTRISCYIGVLQQPVFVKFGPAGFAEALRRDYLEAVERSQTREKFAVMLKGELEKYKNASYSFRSVYETGQNLFKSKDCHNVSGSSETELHRRLHSEDLFSNLGLQSTITRTAYRIKTGIDPDALPSERASLKTVNEFFLKAAGPGAIQPQGSDELERLFAIYVKARDRILTTQRDGVIADLAKSSNTTAIVRMLYQSLGLGAFAGPDAGVDGGPLTPVAREIMEAARAPLLKSSKGMLAGLFSGGTEPALLFAHDVKPGCAFLDTGTTPTAENVVCGYIRSMQLRNTVNGGKGLFGTIGAAMTANFRNLARTQMASGRRAVSDKAAYSDGNPKAPFDLVLGKNSFAFALVKPCKDLGTMEKAPYGAVRTFECELFLFFHNPSYAPIAAATDFALPSIDVTFTSEKFVLFPNRELAAPIVEEDLTPETQKNLEKTANMLQAFQAGMEENAPVLCIKTQSSIGLSAEWCPR